MSCLLYPIRTLAGARAYEQSVLGDDPARTGAAMRQAGRAIGLALFDDYRELREWPASPRLLVLAGKGLNTGDAFVACAALAERLPGLRVDVVATAGEAAALDPLAMAALRELELVLGDSLRVLSVAAYQADPGGPIAVVLDGLYGLGFRPPLREEAAGLLEHLNARDDIDLRASVDLPSGMGEETDPRAFVADFTYIPGVPKEPCVRRGNARWTGRLRFLEIEPFSPPPKAEPEQRLFMVSPRCHRSLNRLRPAHSDKRDYGICLIMAGSVPMPGAALMATLGSLQAGAGLVTTLAPARVSAEIAPSIPEAMWHPLPTASDGGLDAEAVRLISQLSTRASALLIGPGMILDRSTLTALIRLVREIPLPLVLDASALTPDLLSAVLRRPHSAGPVVITPHAGEFARLVEGRDDHHADETLLAFCERYRLITLLKGSLTRVCDGRRIAIAGVGGPVLARGGAGDILAGMLVTLLAQTPEDPWGATLRALTWHGAAADALARESGAVAVRTTDLLGHFAPCLRA